MGESVWRSRLGGFRFIYYQPLPATPRPWHRSLYQQTKTKSPQLWAAREISFVIFALSKNSFLSFGPAERKRAVVCEYFECGNLWQEEDGERKVAVNKKYYKRAPLLMQAIHQQTRHTFEVAGSWYGGDRRATRFECIHWFIIRWALNISLISAFLSVVDTLPRLDSRPTPAHAVFGENGKFLFPASSRASAEPRERQTIMNF